MLRSVDSSVNVRVLSLDEHFQRMIGMLTLLSSHRSLLDSNKTDDSHNYANMMKSKSGRSTRFPLPFDDNKVI